MGRSLLILLDTHVVIWLAQDFERISARAQAAIRDARKNELGVAVSCITLLEIARLASHQQIALTPDAQTVLSEVENRLVVLPITRNVALQAYQLPNDFPQDPADRIIGATALIEDIPLLTADNAIRRSRVVPVIW
ncbi:MAG TPA: type II toxin-antitoxin system VapC family toxin [Dongiaceae bacterium]|nr:type II toxin-antitoxin system VapC family toxin [Dongiaceae bacterium]